MVRKRIAKVTMDSVAKYTQRVRARRHEWHADEPTTMGGADAGPAPYELLLSALGACTVITLQMYAERKGWELGDVHLEMSFFKDGDEDRIERTLRFGAELTTAQHERLLEIADKTPVSKTVMAGSAISTRLA